VDVTQCLTVQLANSVLVTNVLIAQQILNAQILLNMELDTGVVLAGVSRNKNVV
jgi:hypothetical protein